MRFFDPADSIADDVVKAWYSTKPQ